MNAPTPHPVLVSEDFGRVVYVNLVDDPNNIDPSEINEMLAVGPREVSHLVHCGCDEFSVEPYPREWDHLSDMDVVHVCGGTRFYQDRATKVACEQLDIPSACIGTSSTFPMISAAWQTKLREGMMRGELLPEPDWMKAAQKESLYNAAGSAGDFLSRLDLLHDLVLEGPQHYHDAVPTFPEIAAICVNVANRVDEGESLYEAWYGELYQLSPKARLEVYETISTETVPDNHRALITMCTRLSEPRGDLYAIRVHFETLREFSECCAGRDDPDFQRVQDDHEVVARANYYGDDALDDEALDRWRELVESLFVD